MKKLGEILLENKLIDRRQLEKALEKQVDSEKKLGQVLVEMGFIEPEELIEVLEFKLGVSHVNLDDFQIDPELSSCIPENIARRYQTVPMEVKEGKLHIAMADPTNLMALDDLEMITDFKIEPYIATADQIKKVLNILYADGQDAAADVFESLNNNLEQQEPEPDELKKMVDDAPIVRLTNIIINQALKLEASDIHIEPQRANVRVRYRIDGVLVENMTAPKHTQAALVSRLKIMASLDITRRRVPQDGRVRINNKGVRIDMRVSTLPTVHGEKVVIRLLNKDNRLLDIENLGISEKNLGKVKKMINKPHGIILATGPTGSGKSTTLFAALSKLNSPEKNIITIEDPVEYQIRGLNQVQVNSRIGFDFASALRSILRQDPDIIMLGEIRDKETAQIAIRAALTGHLVLSTLHTNDAVSSITRLIDMGVPSYLVAATVKGVIAQRLVRRLCKKCRVKYRPELEERAMLEIDEAEEIYKPGECPACNKGYKGRLALHEILLVDQEIKKMIIEEKGEQEINQTAVERGMITLRGDAIDKVRSGFTSSQEIVKVIV